MRLAEYTKTHRFSYVWLKQFGFSGVPLFSENSRYVLMMKIDVLPR